MKPVWLKISGINSFVSEQEIDFTKLMENGLFGIFGPTGSGKTTVLDGITLSLFGEISRYKSSQKMQFINSELNEAQVKFCFYVGNKKLVVERGFKRTKDSIKTYFARFYKLEETGEIGEIYADNLKEVNEEIRKNIGLTYSDFVHTVILPQGKFSQFLLLENAERRKMLERIFNLEEYGENLNKKILKALNEEKTNFTIISNKLENFNGLSFEILTQEKEKLEKCKNETMDFTKKIETLKTKIIEDEKLINVLNELTLWLQNSFKNDENKENILTKSKLLNQIKDAKIIAPLILEFNDAKKEETKTNKIINDDEIILSNLLIKRDDYYLDYEEKLDFYEKNYNRLLVQNTNIEQSIKIITQLELLKSERNEIVKEFKLYRVKNNEKNSEFKKLNEHIELITKQLNKLNENAQTCYVDENVKKIVRNAFEEEKKQAYFIENYNKSYSAVNQLELECKETAKTVENLKKETDKIESEINLNCTSLFELHLIEEKQKIQFNKLEKELYVLESDFTQKREAVLQLKKLNADISNEENLVAKNKKHLLVIEKRFTQMKKEEEELKKALYSVELQNLLVSGEPCPVCGSINHENMQNNNEQINETLEKTKPIQKIENLRSVLEETENEFSNIKIEIAKSVEKIEIANARVNEIKSKFGEINILEEEKKIAEITKEKDNLKIKIEKLSLEISENESKKIKLEKDLKENNNKFFEVSSKINLDLDILKIKKQDCEIYLNEIEKLKIELDKYSSNLNELNCNTSSSFEVLNAEIEKKEEKYSKILIEQTKLNNNKEEFNKLLKEIENEIAKISENLISLETLGKAKKEEIDRNYVHIKELLISDKHEKIGLTDEEEQMIYSLDEVNKALVKNRIKIEEVELNKNLAHKKHEETKKECDNLTNKIILQKKDLDIFQNKCNNLEQTIFKKIDENKFSNVEEVMQVYEMISKEEKLESEINRYNESVFLCKSNINSLEQILENNYNIKLQFYDKAFEIVQFKNSEIEKDKELLQENEQYLLNKTEETAVLLDKIKRIENDLKIVEITRKEQKIIEKKLDDLNDLASLFKGNKFVDYMSKKQLEYITIEATKRTREMSANRYSLELDGTDFIIRDDFNGGTRRSPRTLSGGETFFVSLALSIALSSKVQLTNKAPLEFFFLDEGFGTLDPNLLDTVINSLENLMLNNMKIGLISHVDELKDRISRKLIVESAVAGESGSKIKLEYN